MHSKTGDFISKSRVSSMKKLVVIDCELVIEFPKSLSFDGQLTSIRSGCFNWPDDRKG